MTKFLVGYEIRNYTSKKDGTQKRFAILYCIKEKTSAVGGRVTEEITVFNQHVVESLNSNLTNGNIFIEYDIVGDRAYIRAIQKAK